MTFLGLKTLSFLLEKQKISSVLEEIDALVSAPICPCLFMLTCVRFACTCAPATLRTLHSFAPYVPTHRG